MESHFSHQLKVGLFVSIGLAGVMISILALGGDRSLFKSYERIYAKLPQVQGLNKGSVVSLSGVTIGNVEKIEFHEIDRQLVVALKIESSYLSRIPVDSRVEMRTQGALGDKYLYILQGQSEETIKPLGRLEPLESTDLLGVLSERGGEIEKIFDVITEVKKLMVTINADNKVAKILADLSEASGNMKLLAADSRKIISEIKSESPKNLNRALQRLDSILGKLDRGEGSLGALINDPSLHNQLKSMMGGSSRKKYMQSVIRSTIERSEKTADSQRRGTSAAD